MKDLFPGCADRARTPTPGMLLHPLHAQHSLCKLGQQTPVKGCSSQISQLVRDPRDALHMISHPGHNLCLLAFKQQSRTKNGDAERQGRWRTLSDILKDLFLCSLQALPILLGLLCCLALHSKHSIIVLKLLHGRHGLE